MTLALDAAAGPYLVSADRGLLLRALENLMSNAVKYSPSGSAVTCRLEHAAADGQRQVRCSVQDQGFGIPAEALPQLFVPFRRIASTDRNRAGGSGLGLAFVAIVAERHGGKVEVESTVGQGSCFSLLLPAEAAGSGSPRAGE